jgi:hypothetical protein
MPGIEQKWPAVPPTLFTSDGSPYGIINVVTAAGLKVKQEIAIVATGQPNITLRVVRVMSPTQIKVGALNPPQGQWFQGVDVSAYTVAAGAYLYAGEQTKNTIKTDDMDKATYDQEPTVAWRSVLVDQFGDYYETANPLPVVFAGSITTTVRRLTDKSGDTTPDGLPDAIQIGDGTNRLHINADGSINVDIGGSAAIYTIKIPYNEVNSVASGVSTTVITYTVPGTATSAFLQRVQVSGENIARYDLLINSSIVATKRTYFGGDLNATFEFQSFNNNGVPLAVGNTVVVKVLHTRPSLASFEATIQVAEVT